jgi:hypothetical protein
LCPSRSDAHPSESGLRQINPVVATGSITIGSCRTQIEKGRRNAEKRIYQFSAPSGAAARSKPERARLSAFHRGSRQAAHCLLTQLQAGFLGLGTRRHYRPYLSQYRDAPPAPAISTGRRDARSRPGASYELARRHRTRSINWPSPIETLTTSET